MKTAIRKTGNSQGGVIPKPLLAQVGLEVEAEMFVEKGAIVIRKPRRAPIGPPPRSKSLPRKTMH